MISFDLLPQPRPEDANDPTAVYRWLYRVWLKLKDSYYSEADLSTLFNTASQSIGRSDVIPNTPTDDSLIMSVFAEQDKTVGTGDTSINDVVMDVAGQRGYGGDVFALQGALRDSQILVAMGGN
jgi:hypothetical protein